MGQAFDTVDVARLEVQLPWPDMPNLLTNPYPIGRLGSTSSWNLPVRTPQYSLTATTGGLVFSTTVFSGNASHALVGVTHFPGARARVRINRVASTAATTSALFLEFYNGPGKSPADDGFLGNIGAQITEDGIVEIASAEVPATCTHIRVVLVIFKTGGGASITFGDAVLVYGTEAEVAAASMLVETDWTNILGPTREVTIERDELQIGVLTAQISDSALDPANVDLIRPGRALRCLAMFGDEREQLFGGQILTGSATYQLRGSGPDEKRTRITLTAVDPLSPLSSVPAPEGVATIDELPFVLARGAVPWNVNGSTVGIDPIEDVTVVSKVDQATVVDQVAITRDSAMGYAWLDRNGVMQAWDADQIPADPVASLTELDYSELDVSFDTERCINTVTIKHMFIDPATGDTTEVTYGPFVDAESVRTWGARAAEFTVHGIDEAALPGYAAAILAANATPVIRINQVTLPLRTLTEFATHVTRDLYDLVSVSNDRAGIDDDLRVVSIKHRITTGKWLVDLNFAADQSVAPPQVTPSPNGPGAQTQAQRLRPVGEVTMFYGLPADVPAGWLVCDGSIFDEAAFPSLATLLGGNTLPSLVDRFPIGAGIKALGTSGGSPTETLTVANLPAHTHGAPVAPEAGTSGDRVVEGNTTPAGTVPTTAAGAAEPEAFDVMPPWRAIYFIIRAA